MFSKLLKLEPRLVFDAAIGATVNTISSEPDNTEATDSLDTTPSTDGADQGLTASKEVAFIDSNLDYVDQLIAGMREGVDVVILDANRDGLEQIGEWLASHHEIDAVHIFSHGTAGEVHLGLIDLNASNVSDYSSSLLSWRDSLSENADILIYGCDVGAGSGPDLIDAIKLYTGADVAASLDATGSSALGGNWSLELADGTINVPVALTEMVQQEYAALLAPEKWTITNQSVSEGVLITFTLTRENGTGNVTVNYATTSGTASATDYDGASGSLTFSGNQSKTFTVQTTQDSIYELDETFTVTVSNLSGGTSSKTATGTILNDDTAPTFSIASSSATEGNSISFTVTRSGLSEVTQAVTYSTANGTAISGTDFTAASGTLTFDKNSGNTNTFTVNTTGDLTYENDETLTANISWGSGPSSGSASATGTITNDDPLR